MGKKGVSERGNSGSCSERSKTSTQLVLESITQEPTHKGHSTPRYSVTLQLICALSVTEKMFMYKMPYFCIRYT